MRVKWKEGLPKNLKPGSFYFIRDRFLETPVPVWGNSLFVFECLRDKEKRPRLYDGKLEDMTDVIMWDCPEYYEYCEIELCD